MTAKRDLNAAKRFFRKMLKDEPLLSPQKIGTDGANTFPSGSYILIRFIMSPSIFSKALRATTSG